MTCIILCQRTNLRNTFRVYKRERGEVLQFVKNQTPEICLTAVKQNGEALKYVKNQTSEISLEVVKQNGMALRSVRY